MSKAPHQPGAAQPPTHHHGAHAPGCGLAGSPHAQECGLSSACKARGYGDEHRAATSSDRCRCNAWGRCRNGCTDTGAGAEGNQRRCLSSRCWPRPLGAATALPPFFAARLSGLFCPPLAGQRPATEGSGPRGRAGVFTDPGRTGQSGYRGAAENRKADVPRLTLPARGLQPPTM